MDHEQTLGVNSRVLDQKQQNIFGRISLFWSVELQGHPEQLTVVPQIVRAGASLSEASPTNSPREAHPKHPF